MKILMILWLGQALSNPTKQVVRVSPDGHFLIEASPSMAAHRLYADIIRSKALKPGQMCEGDVIWSLKLEDGRTVVEAYVKDGHGALNADPNAEREAPQVWARLRQLLAVGVNVGSCGSPAR
jgi:hypothetical protein